VGGAAQVKAMKQVAGTLKLDLAQYRELAAFAQFGSDLDKATQAQLDRGIRLVEILNQPQFAPMSLAKEVVILYAGTRGFLDKYPVDKIKNYEPQLLAFVEGKYPEIMKEIDETKIIGPELDKKLREVLAEFDAVYVAE
jgi:F-type H+-transporting ATPase subunit alpha